MLTLYFGPQRDVPSWYWVGQDIAEHLRGRYRIRYFTTVADIEPGSVVFWIKSSPAASDAQLVQERKLRVVYMPVDQYQSEAEIARDRAFIDACALLACHTATMRDLFPSKPVELIDHYNKYGIDPSRRVPDGRFLWIGGYQYFPYIYRYLVGASLDLKVVVLTDYRRPVGIDAANRLGRQIGLDLDFRDIRHFPGVELVEWNEARQESLLRSCAGAFDYKHVDDFNQRFKPPTKIQKYLASGIPTAVNRDSFSFKHMADWGVELCAPCETDIWRSAAYQARIHACGEALRQQLTMQVISRRYEDFAHQVAT